MRLFLLIPSYRPHWAWRCVRFYLTEMEPHPFELRTIVASQNVYPDPCGIQKLNECLDLIDSDCPSWLFTFADDTIQHASLFRRLGETIEAKPHARAVMFDQVTRHAKDGTGVLRVGPNNCRPCHCCGGQVAWRRDFIGNNRFGYAEFGGRCDGEFIQARYRENPEAFVFVNEPLTYFGSFETEGVPE